MRFAPTRYVIQIFFRQPRAVPTMIMIPCTTTYVDTMIMINESCFFEMVSTTNKDADIVPIIETVTAKIDPDFGDEFRFENNIEAIACKKFPVTIINTPIADVRIGPSDESNRSPIPYARNDIAETNTPY